MKKIFILLAAVFLFAGDARATSFKNPAFAGEWDPLGNPPIRMTVKENGMTYENGDTNECHLIDNEQEYVTFFCYSTFNTGYKRADFIKLQIDSKGSINRGLKIGQMIFMITDEDLNKLRKDNNGESWYIKKEPRFGESPFLYGEWTLDKDNEFLKGDIKITKKEIGGGFMVLDNSNNALDCEIPELVTNPPYELHSSCWRGKMVKKKWISDGKEYSSSKFEISDRPTFDYYFTITPKSFDQPLWKIKEMKWQLKIYDKENNQAVTYHRTDKLPD